MYVKEKRIKNKNGKKFINNRTVATIKKNRFVEDDISSIACYKLTIRKKYIFYMSFY